jgi:hypothetical protein
VCRAGGCQGVQVLPAEQARAGLLARPAKEAHVFKGQPEGAPAGHRPVPAGLLHAAHPQLGLLVQPEAGRSLRH